MPKGGKIKRAADTYRHEGRRSSAEAIIDLFREKGVTVPEPSSTIGGTPVIAYINHGRWIGDCGLYDASRERTCQNAQLVDADDARFYCVICFNDAIGGQWRSITWPENPEFIEESLAELPINEQNWTPS